MACSKPDPSHLPENPPDPPVGPQNPLPAPQEVPLDLSVTGLAGSAPSFVSAVRNLYTLSGGPSSGSCFSRSNEARPDSGVLESFKVLNHKEEFEVTKEQFLSKLTDDGRDVLVKVVSIIGPELKAMTLNHTFFDGEKIFHASSKMNPALPGLWVAYHPKYRILVFDFDIILNTLRVDYRTGLVSEVIALSDVVIYRIRNGSLSGPTNNDIFEYLGLASINHMHFFGAELDKLASTFSLVKPRKHSLVVVAHEPIQSPDNRALIYAKLKRTTEKILKKTVEIIPLTTQDLGPHLVIYHDTVGSPGYLDGMRSEGEIEEEIRKRISALENFTSEAFCSINYIYGQLTGQLTEPPKPEKKIFGEDPKKEDMEAKAAANKYFGTGYYVDPDLNIDADHKMDSFKQNLKRDAQMNQRKKKIGVNKTENMDPSLFVTLRNKIVELLNNDPIRVPRKMSVVFDSLQALVANAKEKVEMIQKYCDFLYRCPDVCLQCLKQCCLTKIHDSKKLESPHYTEHACKYNTEYGNALFYCPDCYEIVSKDLPDFILSGMMEETLVLVINDMIEKKRCFHCGVKFTEVKFVALHCWASVKKTTWDDLKTLPFHYAFRGLIDPNIASKGKKKLDATNEK